MNAVKTPCITISITMHQIVREAEETNVAEARKTAVIGCDYIYNGGARFVESMSPIPTQIMA